MAKKPVEKSKSPEMEFILEQMRKNRSVTFAEVRDAAKAKGMTIYPISYGRAQYTLGIVRKGRKKKAAETGGTPAKRGPGRPPKTDTSTPAKRGPGRPPKVASGIPARRGPGRPPKARAMMSGDPLAALQGIAEEMASLKRALAEIAEIAARV